MPAAIPAIIGVAGSIGGALLGPKKTSQTNTAQLDPQQQAIHEQLAKIFGGELSAGPSIPQWMKNSGRTDINETYNSMLPRMEQNLAARGFDTSGKMGSAAQAIEMGRGNAFQKLQSSLSTYADQRYQRMLEMAQQFQRPTGSSSTQTGSNPWQVAIPGIGSDLSTLLQLRQKGQQQSPGEGANQGSGEGGGY
jgi:hypothetical protein